jgi:hypothetical protein
MRKAGDILSSLFNEKFDPVFLKKARTTAGLFTSWEDITREVSHETHDVGIASAAAHSRIAELEHGILLIEADHPGWRQILQTKQSQLLNTVRRRYSELEIRGIVFRLSRDPQSFSVAAEAPVDEPPDPEPVVLSSAGEPDAASPQTDPAAEEAYNSLKKRLEESIKRRNKNRTGRRR